MTAVSQILDLIFHNDERINNDVRSSLEGAINNGDDINDWIKNAGNPNSALTKTIFKNSSRSERKAAQKFIRSPEFKETFNASQTVSNLLDVWENEDRNGPYKIGITRLLEKGNFEGLSLSQEKKQNIREFFSNLEENRRNEIDALEQSAQPATANGALSEEDKNKVLDNYKASRGPAPASATFPTANIAPQPKSVASMTAKIGGSFVKGLLTATTLPYILSPLAKMGRDFKKVAPDFVNYHIPRFFSFWKSMEIVTGGVSYKKPDGEFNTHGGIFPAIDNLKTTSVAGLSFAIDPKNATEENRLYQERASKVATDDLTGSLKSASTSLEKLGQSTQGLTNDMSQAFTGFAATIEDLKTSIQNVDSLSDRIEEFKAKSSELSSVALQLLSATKDTDIETYKLSLVSDKESETDETNIAALETAITALDEILANEDAKPSERNSSANKAFSALAQHYQRRARNVGKEQEIIYSRGEDVINQINDQIEDLKKKNVGLDTFLEAAKTLGKNIDTVELRLSHIEAPPPSKNKDPLRGGSVTGRLAAFEARPHFEHVKTFSEKLSSVASELESGLSLEQHSSKLSRVNLKSPTLLDDLGQLQAFFSAEAQRVSNSTPAKFNGLYSDMYQAEDSVRSMSDAVLKYTSLTRNRGHNYFTKDEKSRTGGGQVKGANTIYMVDFNVGRIDAAVTDEHKERFKELVKSGQLVVAQPKERKEKTPEEYTEYLLDYRPGEDAKNISAENTVLYKTPDHKFLEGYLTSQNPEMIPSIINRMTTMIERDDFNGVIECFKFAALTYARNPETFQAQGSRADGFYDELMTKISDIAKGREGSNRWAGAFDDRIEKTFRAINQIIADVSANTTRDRFVPFYNATRPFRYHGDHKNELQYANQHSAEAKEKKMTDKEYAEFLIKDMTQEQAQEFKISLQERAFARYFDSGIWRKDAEYGIKPFFRPFAALMSTKLSGFIPYKMSYFGDAEQKRRTWMFKIAPRVALTGLLATGAYLGSTGVDIDMNNIFDSNSSRPQIEFTMPDAPSASQQYTQPQTLQPQSQKHSSVEDMFGKPSSRSGTTAPTFNNTSGAQQTVTPPPASTQQQQAPQQAPAQQPQQQQQQAPKKDNGPPTFDPTASINMPSSDDVVLVAFDHAVHPESVKAAAKIIDSNYEIEYSDENDHNMA